MDLYVLIRRNGWASADAIMAADARSTIERERRADRLRHVRSYVVDEPGGLGSICLYEAESRAALLEHGAAADLPEPEIIKVAGTVISRDDPEPVRQA
jgi:Protein of unknown function (DUF4242)